MAHHPTDLSTASARLRHARARAGHSSAAAFATAAKVRDVTYRAHENGTRNLTVSAARSYAPHLGVSWQWLVFGDEMTPQPSAAELPRRAHRDSVAIAEIDVKAGAGGGGEALVQWKPGAEGGVAAADAVAGHWEFPAEFLRTELRVELASVRILAVLGDSMEPLLQSGDRVMVDLSDRSPSPPGIYALWDGLGVVVKRLEHVMGTEPPRLRISSDNDRHQTYERTLDEVNIIGRVVWVARRL